MVEPRTCQASKSCSREQVSLALFLCFLHLADLPLSQAADTAEAESFKHQRKDIFSNQGPAYFGDEDEQDGELLKYEQEAEAEGNLTLNKRL